MRGPGPGAPRGWAASPATRQGPHRSIANRPRGGRGCARGEAQGRAAPRRDDDDRRLAEAPREHGQRAGIARDQQVPLRPAARTAPALGDDPPAHGGAETGEHPVVPAARHAPAHRVPGGDEGGAPPAQPRIHRGAAPADPHDDPARLVFRAPIRRQHQSSASSWPLR
jgi:hypothetical protein